MELIESILAGLRHTSMPEAASVVFGLLYSILAVRRTRWCWVAGALSSSILIAVAWQAKLPMQACLQAYYVGMAVYGFRHWSQDEGGAKTVTTWPLRMHLISCVPVMR
jgi:nicotinamide mononucleotide transporter